MLTFTVSNLAQAQPFRWPFPPNGRTEEAPSPQEGSGHVVLLVLQEIAARNQQADRRPEGIHLRRVHRNVQRDHCGRSVRTCQGRSRQADRLHFAAAGSRAGSPGSHHRCRPTLGGLSCPWQRYASLNTARRCCARAAVLRYDAAVTGPTVNGRGNPDNQHRRPCTRNGLRVRASPSLVAPNGASFGWAGPLVPVFHPRSCAAAPHPPEVRGGRRWPAS